MKKLLTILFLIAFAITAHGQIPLGSSFGLNSGVPLDAREVKADLTARNAIPAVARYEGLTVYVTSEEEYYQLIGGVTNSDWIALAGGGGSIVFDTVTADFFQGGNASFDTVVNDLFYAGKLESRVVDTLDLTTDPVWQENSSNLYFDPSTSAVSYLRNTSDTISFAYSNIAAIINRDLMILNTEDSTNAVHYSHGTTSRLINYKNKKTVIHEDNGLYMYPGVGDTVKLDDRVVGSFIQFQTYAPDPTSFVELGNVNVESLYAGIDENTSIDSLTAFHMKLTDAGADPGSIGKIYGIKNEDDGLRGSEETYFLYSEYGDNYLNGDVTAKDFKYIYPATIDMDDYYNAILDKSQYSAGAGTFTVATNSSDEHNVLFDRTDTILIGNEGSGTFKVQQHTINVNSSEDSDALILPHSDFVIFTDLETTKDIRVFSDNSMLFPEALDTIVMDQFELNQQRVLTSTPATSRIAINELIHTNKYVSFDDHLSVDSATFIQLRAQDVGIDSDSISKLYMIKNIDGGLRGADKTYFLYSEYGDNYLNGDLDVHGRFTEYPYGTINATDYYRTEKNKDLYNYRAGTFDITPSDKRFSLYYSEDTLNYESAASKLQQYSYKGVFLNSEVPTTQLVTNGWVWNLQHNDYEAPSGTGVVTGSQFMHDMYPSDGDTVKINRYVGSLFQTSGYSPYSNSRMDVGGMTGVHLFGSLGNYMAVDSLIGLLINYENDGIDPDSIGAYYGIYHIDETIPEGASGRTYFLYSEIGDNYLNGDVDALRFHHIYPDELDLSAETMFGPNTRHVYDLDAGTFDLTQGLTRPINMFQAKLDSINLLNYSTYSFAVEADFSVVNSVDPLSGDKLFFGSDNFIEHNNFVAPLFDAYGVRDIYRLVARADDTIKLEHQTAKNITAYSWANDPNSYIKIGEQKILELSGIYDDNVAVDSVIALNIDLNNIGMDSDSIIAVYGIYNEDGGQRGKDRTYFLYSEYGDNYLNGKVEAQDYNIIHPSTMDLDDYTNPSGFKSYQYQDGETDLTLPSGASFWNLRFDTLNIVSEDNSSFAETYEIKTINSEERVGANLWGHNDVYRFENIDGLSLNPFNLAGRFQPGTDDTINIDSYRGTYIATTSVGGTATSRINLGDAVGLYVYNSFNEYTAVDSITGLKIVQYNNGTPADSIDKVYGIYHEDYNDGGLRGKDATYFLYSEYGDNYLNGKLDITDNLTITNAGGLDQYGAYLNLGADIPTFTSRTDAVNKTGNITMPHYNTAEEDVYYIGGLSSGTLNTVQIGGGNGARNAATSIRLYSAENTTTTTGTQVGEFDINGFHVDTISVLNNSVISVNDDLQLLNGAELDQYGKAITLGADVSDYLDRTDATTKSGGIKTPHYTNAEESINLILQSSTSANNLLSIGGGDNAYNTATRISFYSAADNTTTSGTKMGQFDINGFHTDTISELTTDAGVYVEGTHFRDDTVTITGILKYEPPHAKMTFESESETLTMDQNTWVKFTNGTDDLFSSTDANKITQAGDSLTITIAGDYMINASISFSGTTNADLYEFAVFVNDVKASIAMPRTTTSTDIGNVSLPIYLEGLQAGDDICLKIRNTANDFDATLIACSWITTLLHTE